MREIFEVVEVNGEKLNQIRIEFESEKEAEVLINSLRVGFPKEHLQSSINFLDNFHNKQLFSQIFANMWVLIKIAREAPNDESFRLHMNTNPFFYELCKNMDKEFAKLMLVLIDAAGRKRVRRVATAKDIRKRLASYKDLLQECAGKDFKIEPLDNFPEIKTN